MQSSIPVVTLAQKEALAAFAQLADAMIDAVEVSTNQALRTASLHEQRVLGEVRSFLRDDGRAFRRKLVAAHEGLLERAMQTMHTDLRSGMREVRADSLSLIEDDVVTREIEVHRLVTRLRDADQISLGQINLIIAQLHGVSEVSERENPFRPYLLARALQETLRQMMGMNAPATVLFQHCSVSMATGAGKYYSRIRAVFEAQGVRSRLMARPTAANRAERDRAAWQRAADQLNGKVAAAPNAPEEETGSLMPRMQRMLEIVQYEGTAAQNGTASQARNLQELVLEVFQQPRGSRVPRKVPDEIGRARLNQRLLELQRSAASAAAGEAAESPLALRDRIADVASPHDRLTIDLVGLLFEFIRHDEQMAAPMRHQLVRLHLPFLRAALLQPTLLQDPGHAARRLLDRAGTLSAGIATATPMDSVMLIEMHRIVSDILTRFDSDPKVFGEGEAALDRAYLRLLATRDPAAARAAPALTRAETAGAALDAVRAALRALLEPVQADRRMIDFIVTSWSQVMVYCHDTHPSYRAMLPELLWSAQEKPGPEDRTLLMRLLPDMGKRLRAGLAQVAMPEQQVKEALDKLMVVHMDVLANKRLRSNAVRLSQQALNQEMLRFKPEQLIAQARAEGAIAPSGHDLQASLSAVGIAAVVCADPAGFIEQPTDPDYLEWARQGTPFEVLVGTDYQPLMLEAASAAGMAYLFRPQHGNPVVYTRQSLLAAMRDGILRPVEHAPLFERAVGSLMTGAESLSA